MQAQMEIDILLLLPHSSLYVHSPHSTQGGPMGQTGPCGRSSHSGVNPSAYYAPERATRTRTKTRTLVMTPLAKCRENPSYQIQQDLQSWYPYQRLVVPGTGSRGNPANLKRLR